MGSSAMRWQGAGTGAAIGAHLAWRFVSAFSAEQLRQLGDAARRVLGENIGGAGVLDFLS